MVLFAALGGPARWLDEASEIFANMYGRKLYDIAALC
jgi:hypothetical protein